ncbi:MAG TPA: lanthionine synthetase LanC family protein, partial [Vicinamibacterales bacterium]|nr:lanthionine synthetase LanC family protein [Vicinamibacterales bacterium]
PGISIAAASPNRAGGTIAPQAMRALERLPEWGPNQADHVCCGHLGRVDVLLAAEPALGATDAVSRARAIGRRVLARARAHQHFRLSTPGFEYRVFDPGFFKGLSGIGYGFLRLADPGRLPSILSFDVLRSSSVVRSNDAPRT